VVALDPGSVRIGVAVCDSGRAVAFPRPPVPAGGDEVARCADVAREESATVVVVGHPLQLDGAAGPAAARADELARRLREVLLPDEIEVVLHDERLTTVTASGRLREAGLDARGARSRVDSASATVLLESWLVS